MQKQDEMVVYKDELETAMVRKVQALQERDAAWQVIAASAHLYRVARVKTTGEYVRIVGLRKVGVFVCEHLPERSQDYGAEELNCYSI